MKKEWVGFKPGRWMENVNLRDFISLNYKPYDGNEEFLCGTTKKTNDLFKIVQELQKEEIKRGILGIDINNISGIDNFDPGYIDQDNEIIVGLQTDEPFKRIINPYGGIRMVESAMHAYGHDVPNNLIKIFSQYTKTHNQGVFDAYTEEMKTARNVGLLTGLPDAYGRGRIVGDYRRIPLYGVDFLIKEKEHDFKTVTCNRLKEAIALREEISMQILALKQIKSMAGKYGFDISVPAVNAMEAVQFLYFGYLAAIKQNNGAAMSLGRDTAFLDIYFERDMKNGLLNEEEAQEIIDQFVIKLRMVRHLRTNEYNELFAGDPAWVTEVIGGMAEDGKHMVTKTSYRFIHTLKNLCPSPEPNITILWSEKLPENFKKYCAKVSIQTSSIQYENDDVMRPIYGDDYCIACCISALREGKEMQLFGARCNLAKSLLYAINGGMDELKKIKVIEGIEPDMDEVLDYDKVTENFDYVMEKVAEIYVGAMNVIHYMHDRYAYESSMMALHDSLVGRYMAFGVAGLSIVADSLSAIKYAKVKPVRENGIAIDFEIEGEYPQFGNDDDRVDLIAEEVVEKFINALRKVPAYRGARHTLSVLTITSNVVYGKKTGSTPDGRKSGEPFAPGANPLHGRDKNGLLASLNSVAKLKYKDVCEDGISNTITIVPHAIGKIERHRIDNLVSILSGYFIQGGHHLNINILDRETLLDAMKNPDQYPTLTIRVSGYAVNFNRLTREQQMEIINRSFHDKI